MFWKYYWHWLFGSLCAQGIAHHIPDIHPKCHMYKNKYSLPFVSVMFTHQFQKFSEHVLFLYMIDTTWGSINIR